jgi:integrase
MGLRDGLIKTSRKGIYYKEHPTRKNGVKKDRLFVLRYKLSGKEYVSAFGWETEGKTELDAEIKLTELKGHARDSDGPVSLGQERREAKARAAAEITIDTLVAEYIEDYAKKFKVSWKEDQRSLTKDVLTEWTGRKVKEITRLDASRLLKEIAKRAPVQACNTLEKCRKMFNWAVSQGYIEINPFAGQEPPAPRPERTRVLSEAEIRTLWAALDGDGIVMSQDMRRALKLILVTGQRPGEVIGMHRREIDGNWWTIPAERSKNGKEHRVYLSKEALELVGEGKGFIFPSPKTDATPKTAKPIAVNAMALTLRRNILGAGNHDKRIKGATGRKKVYAAKKAAEPAIVNRVGVEHFTPHDLRRTFVTGLSRIRVPYEVRERIVNHSPIKLEKTYNQHDFDAEKMIAMQRWAAELQRILGKQPAQVISIAS